MDARIPGPSQVETLPRLLLNGLPAVIPFLTEVTARYGNVWAFQVLWAKSVFVNEPAPIKDILVTQQHAFVKPPQVRATKHLLGDGLGTSEDPLHRQMRRIVQPAFHRERIAVYGSVMESAASDLVERLRPGEPLDVHAAMIDLTLRIVTMTLFGSDESGSAREVGEAMRTMMEMFALPFVNFRMRLPLPRTQRFKHARRRLDAVIYDLIARRRRDGSDRTDALSMLLAARDAETGYQPSEGQIRDEVVTLFGAGHETTASLLTWTLYLLAQNPQIDERMGIAVRDGDREFILRVVRETLRLYPPAWLIGRETRQDVTLIDGTTIPAKTAIFISPLLLHRRPEYFPDPLRFDPDRWLGPEPPQFAYVPFGGGARRCIGEDFTWNEAAIVLQTLLRRYSFALEPNAHVEAQASASLRPAGPVMMRPRERIAVEAPALN